MEMRSEKYITIPLTVQLHGADTSGKSNVFNRYIKDEFKEGMSGRFNPQTGKKIEVVDNTDVTLYLKDTTLAKNQSDNLNLHYRHPAVHLLVCDMSYPADWEKLPTIIEQIKYYDKSPIIYLVGTKADLEDDIRITREDIADFALTNKLTGYQITSARNNLGITELFSDIAKLMIIEYPNLIQINEKNRIAGFVNKLNAYIKRIESSKTKFGEIDFSQGFWFFAASRAINREADYLLAKALVVKLNNGTFSEVLKDVEAYRNREIIGVNRLNAKPDFADRGLNCEELLSIIEEIKLSLKQEDVSTSLTI